MKGGPSQNATEMMETTPQEFQWERFAASYSVQTALATVEKHNVASIISVALTRKSLPSIGSIISESRSVDEFDDFSGVYLLIDSSESKVVYVGQSTNVMGRIKSHLRERSQKSNPLSKTFDRYAWIPCRNQDLDVLESLFIHSHQPKYNSAPPRISFDFIFRAAAEKYEKEKAMPAPDLLSFVNHCLQTGTATDWG